MQADNASSRTVMNFMKGLLEMDTTGTRRKFRRLRSFARPGRRGHFQAITPKPGVLGDPGVCPHPGNTVPGTEKSEDQTRGFTICTKWKGAFMRAVSGASMRPVER